MLIVAAQTHQWDANFESFESRPAVISHDRQSKTDGVDSSTGIAQALTTQSLHEAKGYGSSSRGTIDNDMKDESGRTSVSLSGWDTLKHEQSSPQRRQRQPRRNRQRRARSSSPGKETCVSSFGIDLNMDDSCERNNDQSERGGVQMNGSESGVGTRKKHSTSHFCTDWHRDSITSVTESSTDLSGRDLLFDDEEDHSDDFSYNYNDIIKAAATTTNNPGEASSTCSALKRLTTIELNRTKCYHDEAILEKMRTSSYRGLWDQHELAEEPQEAGGIDFTSAVTNSVDYLQDILQKATENMGKTAEVLAEEPSHNVLSAIIETKLDCFGRNIETLGMNGHDLLFCDADDATDHDDSFQDFFTSHDHQSVTSNGRSTVEWEPRPSDREQANLEPIGRSTSGCGSNQQSDRVEHSSDFTSAVTKSVDYVGDLLQEATDNMGKTAEELVEEPNYDAFSAMVETKLNRLSQNVQTIGSWLY